MRSPTASLSSVLSALTLAAIGFALATLAQTPTQPPAPRATGSSAPI
jgi:hypothetical protein